MHIPDGYLGPKTCVAFYGVMAPLLFVASKKLERSIDVTELPRLSLAAAFVFVIMMFNFPMPGGSSGHIVGASLVSILFGPWAGLLSMTLALTLQALLFGDGGVLALGANAFNMAFVMSFVSYVIYAYLSSPSGSSTLRDDVAVFLAAYVAVNMAALTTAIQIGMQVVLEHAPDGTPLYAPFPLSVSVPAMIVPHLIFFGPIEGLGTMLIVRYLRSRKGALSFGKSPALKEVRPFYALLLLLILLTPLGLLAGGTSWGEWGAGELEGVAGFVPEGLARFGDFFNALMPGYSVSWTSSWLGYILSALVGSVIIVALVLLLGRLRKSRQRSTL